MKTETKVHRWTTRSQYFDIQDGTELSKQTVERDYDIIKKRKRIKIKNYHGYITIENECERKRQTKLW